MKGYLSLLLLPEAREITWKDRKNGIISVKERRRKISNIPEIDKKRQ